jgi:hypothetical protein
MALKTGSDGSRSTARAYSSRRNTGWALKKAREPPGTEAGIDVDKE